jgi:hypothetical protein
MREDTVTTKVYKFDELSDEAKETTIEKLYNVNVDYDWWECTYEDARTIALTLEGFDLDRNRHATGKWQEDAEASANAILENHGESCETHKDATEFLFAIGEAAMVFEAKDDYDPEYEEFDETYEYETLCAEFLKTILEDYSIMLQKESEYLQSEEAIIETIKANEYEFTVDGIMY